VRIPQVLESPALTEANMPPGGDASPWSFEPQHETMPPSRTAQACDAPDEIMVKRPSGGLA
jgi:hypothetical protein